MSHTPRSPLKQKLVNTLWHLPKNYLISLKSGNPGRKLKIIGVTGTDGKTSTCVLLYEVLKKAGLRVGLISTIGAKIESDWLDTQLHMTSPDPALIQQLLSQMYTAKVDYVVLEVTSIALDQHRFYGCNFQLGLFLNLSPEHLDYHLNMDNYLLAKSKLLSCASTALANGDDPAFPKLKKLISKDIITFGAQPKNTIRATNIDLDKDFLTFQVEDKLFKTNSNYEYQIYNILGVLAITRQLQIPDEILISTILTYPETKGRREEVANEQSLKCIVDYGHTPQAFLATFSSLRKTYPKNNIISIFGATGGRDMSKRPKMGEIASTFCNLSILTTDDTRQENLKTINTQIISGMKSPITPYILKNKLPNKTEIRNIRKLLKKQNLYLEVDNRQDAITTAVLIAQKNDIVIALGIGHQKTILLGTTEYPWSEYDAFRTALNTKMTLSS